MISLEKPVITPHAFTSVEDATSVTAETLRQLGFEVVDDPEQIDRIRFRTYSGTDFIPQSHERFERANREPCARTLIAATMTNPEHGITADLGIGINGFSRHALQHDTFDWRGFITRDRGEETEILMNNGNHDSGQSEFARNVVDVLKRVTFGAEVGYQPRSTPQYEEWKANIAVQIAPIAGYENPWVN